MLVVYNAFYEETLRDLHEVITYSPFREIGIIMMK